MKKIFYILLFIAGFYLSSPAQVKTAFQGNFAIKTVKFYPNPAASFINFEFLKSYDQSYTLQIYNFIGRKVAEIKPTDKKIVVSLTDFYRGVYIFQLRDKQGSIVEAGKFQVVK
ncbi:MAG: T9SS type A sorting domain-containing protein [Bacteroidota bacterium]|nr:T9SS type A sorting domain-containing protein [Bacteroidota bacterium]MDQ6890399.1 T9SS type A sorting domain-containing protein [Bacteroidota bacterium]